ncbi:MAG: hypothetical protein RRY36_08105 [Bacteroidaceae bacterium]
MAKKVKITQTGKDSTLIQKFTARMKGKVYVSHPGVRALDKIKLLEHKVDSLKNANDSLTIKINGKK